MRTKSKAVCSPSQQFDILHLCGWSVVYRQIWENWFLAEDGQILSGKFWGVFQLHFYIFFIGFCLFNLIFIFLLQPMHWLSNISIIPFSKRLQYYIGRGGTETPKSDYVIYGWPLILVGNLGKLNHIRKVQQGKLGKNRQIRKFCRKIRKITPS